MLDVIVGVVGVLLFLALVVWLSTRESKATRGIDPIPDDLRRADDGLPDYPVSDFGNPMGPTSNR